MALERLRDGAGVVRADDQIQEGVHRRAPGSWCRSSASLQPSYLLPQTAENNHDSRTSPAARYGLVSSTDFSSGPETTALTVCGYGWRLAERKANVIQKVFEGE